MSYLHALLNAVLLVLCCIFLETFYCTEVNLLDADSSRALCTLPTLDDGEILFPVLGMVPRHFFKPNSEPNDIAATINPTTINANVEPT